MKNNKSRPAFLKKVVAGAGAFTLLNGEVEGIVKTDQRKSHIDELHYREQVKWLQSELTRADAIIS